MTREDLETIVLQGLAIDKSAAWLEKKILAVIAEIDLVESSPPTDYEKLDKLHSELTLLYNRNKLEDKISEEFGIKYGFIVTTGKYQAAS